MGSDILETTLSAAQASLSVLLVLAFGYAARKYGLITQEGEQNISKLGTMVFLPCLLFSEMGPSSTWSNLKEFWPIPVWAISFQLLSLAFALTLKVCKIIPSPFVPSFVFNNVTSLPLLLIESLSAAGSLDGLLKGSETAEQLLKRGRVLLLINALVGNLTRFALGPTLMSPNSYLESPFLPSNSKDDDIAPSTSSSPASSTASLPEHADESAPLLPGRMKGGKVETISRKIGKIGKVSAGALNPPLVGGLLAIAFGMIPLTRGVVFEKGWGGWVDPVTQSIKKLGGLFTALQMFVLGSALKSKPSVGVPKIFLGLLFAWRFLLVPALSIGGVWALVNYTDLISDPMMALVLAIAPVGPPALTLCAIADLADITEEIEGQIARIIFLAYIVTPFISTSVAAAITVAKTVQN